MNFGFRNFDFGFLAINYFECAERLPYFKRLISAINKSEIPNPTSEIKTIIFDFGK